MCKKQLTVNILLSIAIAISLFNEGLALKCYMCEGPQDGNDKCWSNPKELELVDCGDETTTEVPTTSTTMTTTGPTIELECIQYVFGDHGDKLNVHRQCVGKLSSITSFCDVLKEEACKGCTEDGCNSAPPL